MGLDGKRVRWLDTPHVPHNWDAGLIYEETTGTLFSSDLFTKVGPAEPITESDIVGPAIAVPERLPFMPPMAEPTLRRLAALKPTMIALMHGPTFKRGGGGGVGGIGGILPRTGGLDRFLSTDRRHFRPICTYESILQSYGPIVDEAGRERKALPTMLER